MRWGVLILALIASCRTQPFDDVNPDGSVDGGQPPADAATDAAADAAHETCASLREQLAALLGTPTCGCGVYCGRMSPIETGIKEGICGCGGCMYSTAPDSILPDAWKVVDDLDRQWNEFGCAQVTCTGKEPSTPVCSPSGKCFMGYGNEPEFDYSTCH